MTKYILNTFVTWLGRIYEYTKNTKTPKTSLNDGADSSVIIWGHVRPCGMLVSSPRAQFSAGCWQAACRLPMRGLSDMRIVTKIS